MWRKDTGAAHNPSKSNFGEGKISLMADETFAVFGAGLLAVYSAGLGIPFLLAAISIWLLDTFPSLQNFG